MWFFITAEIIFWIIAAATAVSFAVWMFCDGVDPELGDILQVLARAYDRYRFRRRMARCRRPYR